MECRTNEKEKRISQREKRQLVRGDNTRTKGWMEGGRQRLGLRTDKLTGIEAYAVKWLPRHGSKEFDGLQRDKWTGRNIETKLIQR